MVFSVLQKLRLLSLTLTFGVCWNVNVGEEQAMGDKGGKKDKAKSKKQTAEKHDKKVKKMKDKQTKKIQ